MSKFPEIEKRCKDLDSRDYVKFLRDEMKDIEKFEIDDTSSQTPESSKDSEVYNPAKWADTDETEESNDEDDTLSGSGKERDDTENYRSDDEHYLSGDDAMLAAEAETVKNKTKFISHGLSDTKKTRTKLIQLPKIHHTKILDLINWIKQVSHVEFAVCSPTEDTLVLMHAGSSTEHEESIQDKRPIQREITQITESQNQTSDLAMQPIEPMPDRCLHLPGYSKLTSKRIRILQALKIGVRVFPSSSNRKPLTIRLGANNFTKDDVIAALNELEDPSTYAVLRLIYRKAKSWTMMSNLYKFEELKKLHS